MAITADTFVRVRIDSETKKRASAALSGMGLTISDAMRILLHRVAHDQTFPLELKVPNAKTIEAMQELEAGGGKSFDSIEALMADLNADD